MNISIMWATLTHIIIIYSLATILQHAIQMLTHDRFVKELKRAGSIKDAKSVYYMSELFTSYI